MSPPHTQPCSRGRPKQDTKLSTRGAHPRRGQVQVRPLGPRLGLGLMLSRPPTQPACTARGSHVTCSRGRPKQGTMLATRGAHPPSSSPSLPRLATCLPCSLVQPSLPACLTHTLPSNTSHTVQWNRKNDTKTRAPFDASGRARDVVRLAARGSRVHN